MSDIMGALKRLNDSIDYLDLAANEQEQKRLKKDQQDLFGASGVDSSAVAKKLDSAIEKVERVLNEA